VRIYGPNWLKTGVAKEMRRVAIANGYYDGLATQANMQRLDNCRGIHSVTGTSLIFTRDRGMHSSGWWKNPDYERCWHLSVSFTDPLTRENRPKDWDLTEEWLDAFFQDDKRFAWAEPPYTPQGKKQDTWHYRVFCDPTWKPWLPDGEVYSKDKTPAGWMSYSDLTDHRARMLQALMPGPGEQ